MSKLLDWFDDRTGCRALIKDILYERLPGGAKWRYVWGSTLLFTFSVQVLTGLFLWTAYSPSSQTAWESVFYIQNGMQLGWFVRGLHHFTAQAMVVLLALHVLQVVVAGAYRAPREVNWWLGIGLLFVTLGLSLTGYLLPWDEKGYWATQVATKIIGITPVVGPGLQQLIQGGPDYGHHTLTRFFALHAGLLPILLSLLLLAHLAVFRRHGVTYPKNAKGETAFWPDQALRDTVACLAVLAVVVFLVVWKGPEVGFAFGPDGGADLGAPADPSRQYSAARPEWYFLFLFQLLKYFPGEAEVIGAIVIPGAVVALLLLFPLLGWHRVGHGACVLATFALLAGAAFLTFTALREDRNNEEFQRAVADAEQNAQRVKQLALAMGIPKGGAIELLRQDPLVQGPILFRDNCALCHRWDGHDGTGSKVLENRNGEPVEAVPSGADLAGFGTQEWIRGFLKNPASDEYFGHTAHKDGEMAKWAAENIPKMTEEEVNAVAALLASQAQREDLAPPAPEVVEMGIDVFSFGGAAETQACVSCHTLEHPDILPGDALVPAPKLTGYASEQWLKGIISNPEHPDFYGDNNDRMPAFAERLSDEQIQLLVDWMRREWYEPN